jgi:integrase
MSKRTKSKRFVGVYYRDLAHGDRSYDFTYHDIEGKKRWITVGKKSMGSSEIDANKKRIETINKILLDGEEPLFITKRKKQAILTLDTVANSYFEDYKKRSKINIYTDALNKYKLHVQPDFGQKNVLNICEVTIKKWLKDKTEHKYAPASVNAYHATIKFIINHGVKHFKELKHFINPAESIPLLELDNARERILSKEEISHILECLKDKPKAFLFTMVSLHTGARPEAIRLLQKKDINISQKRLSISPLKKGKRYHVPINDELFNLLVEYTNNIELEDYIFHPDNPKTIPSIPISYQGIKDQIQPLLNILFNEGLEPKDRIHRVSLYTFRHTFATHLVKNPNINLLDVKNLMSHSRLQMTERYAKIELHEGTSTALNDLYK